MSRMISQLLASESLNNTDYFAIIQEIEGSYSNRKVAWSVIANYFTALLQYKTMVVVGRTGFTDYQLDGTDDNVQLQEAVDYVESVGGGAVYHKGNINPSRISETIRMPEKVRLIGEKFVKGATGGATIKTSAGVNLDQMFLMEGLTATDPVSNADLHHDTGFEHITLDGNNTTVANLRYINQDYSVIDHCRMIQATNSIITEWDSSVDPVASTIPGGLRIDRSLISSISGIGIDLEYQTQCWINDCWFTGTSVDTWIKVKSSNKIHATNCEFNTATTALRFQDTATFPCNDLTFADCAFVGGKAITEERTHANSDRVFISGVQVSGTNDSLVGEDNTVLLSNGIINSRDIEITNDARGLILKDRTTGDRLRLLVDNGVLSTEAV